jgi:hypothetical protein
MNISLRSIIGILLLVTSSAATLSAAPQTPSGGQQAAAYAEYKVISGFKQAFNDALQYHLSKGWQPVGGIAVTTWNNDLYFAQLIGRPAGVSQ